MTGYKFISSPDEIDKEEWCTFVSKHPKGNFFYTLEFYLSLKTTNDYDAVLAACIDPASGQMLGILIATIQRENSGFFRIFTSRCIIYGEPLAINDDVDIQIRLIEYLEKVKKPGAILTQFRFFEPINPELYKYFNKKNYIYEPYLNIINDTAVGIDKIWDGIERRRKQNIRKAMKCGLSFEQADYDKNIEIFYPLLCETYETIKGLFPPKDYFLSLKQHAGSNVFKVFELKMNNEVVVSFTAILSKGTLYANYIGNKKNKEILNLRPVDYFYWELLKWCNENQVAHFNWLGAGNREKDYGVRDFKLKYGGIVFEPGRMKKYNNWLIKITYDFLIGVWKKFK